MSNPNDNRCRNCGIYLQGPSIAHTHHMFSDCCQTSKYGKDAQTDRIAAAERVKTLERLGEQRLATAEAQRLREEQAAQAQRWKEEAAESERRRAAAASSSSAAAAQPLPMNPYPLRPQPGPPWPTTTPAWHSFTSAAAFAAAANTPPNAAQAPPYGAQAPYDSKLGFQYKPPGFGGYRNKSRKTNRRNKYIVKGGRSRRSYM